MKILLVASSESRHASTIANGLQNQYTSAIGPSPFIRLVMTYLNDANLIEPSVSPERVKAEFMYLAKNHPAYDSKAISKSASVDAGTKNIVAVLPVTPASMSMTQKALKSAGFEVSTCMADYLLTSTADDIAAAHTLAGKGVDLHAASARMLDLVKAVGDKACKHHNVMLSAIQQIDKAFEQKASPMSGVLGTAQIVALRLSNKNTAGRTPAVMAKAFMDKAISAMNENKASSFAELPEVKQKELVELAYINCQIDSQQMANVLFNNQQNISLYAKDLHTLITVSEKCASLAGRVNNSASLIELSQVAERIDTLITDPKFTSESRRYLFMPDTLHQAIEQKALEFSSSIPVKDSAKEQEYNPRSPATSVMNITLGSANALFEAPALNPSNITPAFRMQ
jgi:hypothetical protein